MEPKQRRCATINRPIDLLLILLQLLVDTYIMKRRMLVRKMILAKPEINLSFTLIIITDMETTS